MGNSRKSQEPPRNAETLETEALEAEPSVVPQEVLPTLPPHGDVAIEVEEVKVDFVTAVANLTLFQQGVVRHKFGTYGLRTLSEWLSVIQ